MTAVWIFCGLNCGGADAPGLVSPCSPACSPGWLRAQPPGPGEPTPLIRDCWPGARDRTWRSSPETRLASFLRRARRLPDCRKPPPSPSAACIVCCRLARPLRRSTRFLSGSTPMSARKPAETTSRRGWPTRSRSSSWARKPRRTWPISDSCRTCRCCSASRSAHSRLRPSPACSSPRSGGGAAISPSCARSAAPAPRSAAPRRGRRARYRDCIYDREPGRRRVRPRCPAALRPPSRHPGPY